MIAIPLHEIRHLATRRLGRTSWAFPRLDSTNSLALALADESANDGLVLLADEQTSGRGQFGRVWTAPPASSVLMSVLVLPPPSLRRPALLTAWAAVSVCQTIAEVAALEPTIKWPNDVLVAGHKVCGILIEQRNTGLAGNPLACAVGIGLNVSQDADFFVKADLPLAGSLRTLCGKTLDTRLVAERLICQLDEGYDRLVADDTRELEHSWKRLLGLEGKHVALTTVQGRVEGHLLDVGWGGIVLRSGDETVRMAPEGVRQIENLSEAH